MKSGGTANSIADGYYDRTSDLLYVSLADLNKVEETVAHENFHALQRVTDRVSPNLFTQEEQTALDTFLPGGTIDSISPAVQKALGNDVMSKLRERHADRPLDKRELQAYAFAAYTTLQNKNRLLPAPNPVIRAFKKLFDFIKRAGNIFRKNKITSVKDIFDKARLGDIGKRAKPRTDVDIETLRTKSIEQSEKAAARGEAQLQADKMSLDKAALGAERQTWTAQEQRDIDQMNRMQSQIDNRQANLADYREGREEAILGTVGGVGSAMAGMDFT